MHTPGRRSIRILIRPDNMRLALTSVPLTDDECDAMDGGHAALDQLLGQLTYLPARSHCLQVRTRSTS